MKEWIIKIAIAIICAIAIGMILVKKADAAPAQPAPTKRELVKECTNSAFWRSIGAGATYGGVVQGLGAALAVGLSPTPVGAAAGATIVAGNIITGVLIGGGASAATHLSLANRLGDDFLGEACLRKLAATNPNFPAVMRKAVAEGPEQEAAIRALIEMATKKQ